MKKQKKLVVGNWKMNPETLEEAKAIANSVKKISKSLKKTQVVVCPPFVYLPIISKAKGGSVFIGAQNAHYEANGPFTGEVSYTFLPQFGVDFVILGHSERRKMGESDELVNKKVKSVVNLGMTSIICVGESTRDHNGDYLLFLKQQILSALKDVPKKLLGKIVIAYEPIWAVGAKDAIKPRDLHEMSIYIKKVLKDAYGDLSDDIRVLYGGDVDRFNDDELIKEGGVSGFLIGRESLKPKDFVEIIKVVDSF